MLSMEVPVLLHAMWSMVTGKLTADVASALMSRKALGSAGQNRLNIIGSAVGSAEWGSSPAIANLVTCRGHDI